MIHLSDVTIPESADGGKYWIFDRIDEKYKAVDVSQLLSFSLTLTPFTYKEFPGFTIYSGSSKSLYVIDGLTGTCLGRFFSNSYDSWKPNMHKAFRLVTRVDIDSTDDNSSWVPFLEAVFANKERHGSWTPGTTEHTEQYFRAMYVLAQI